jgi:putative oxidoreductase
MSGLLFWYGGLGFVIPRIILGTILIVHGWSKIRDLKQNAANFSGMGFKPGALWGTVAAIVEFFGGVLLVLGIWVSYVCLVLLGEFIVIIAWRWTKKMPFVGGWEFDAALFGLLLLFFTLYGGFFLWPFGNL